MTSGTHQNTTKALERLVNIYYRVLQEFAPKQENEVMLVDSTILTERFRKEYEKDKIVRAFCRESDVEIEIDSSCNLNIGIYLTPSACCETITTNFEVSSETEEEVQK